MKDFTFTVEPSDFHLTGIFPLDRHTSANAGLHASMDSIIDRIIDVAPKDYQIHVIFTFGVLYLLWLAWATRYSKIKVVRRIKEKLEVYQLIQEIESKRGAELEGFEDVKCFLLEDAKRFQAKPIAQAAYARTRKYAQNTWPSMVGSVLAFCIYFGLVVAGLSPKDFENLPYYFIYLTVLWALSLPLYFLFVTNDTDENRLEKMFLGFMPTFVGVYLLSQLAQAVLYLFVMFLNARMSG